MALLAIMTARHRKIFTYPTVSEAMARHPNDDSMQNSRSVGTGGTKRARPG